MRHTLCTLGLLLLCGGFSAATAQTSAPVPKGYVSVGGGYQATSRTFDDAATRRVNAEDGQFRARYEVKGGPLLDVAGGVTVWQRLAVGVGVTRFSRDTVAAASGSIPHPFFFNRPRAIDGEITGLSREELAVHVQARALLPAGARVLVAVFGGPSFFQVKQGVVTDIGYVESYPYDTASLGSATTTTPSKSAVGFNVGADVGFFFTRQIGVGVAATFTGASVDVPGLAGGTRQVKAGGAQVGGGLRIRF